MSLCCNESDCKQTRTEKEKNTLFSQRSSQVSIKLKVIKTHCSEIIITATVCQSKGLSHPLLSSNSVHSQTSYLIRQCSPVHVIKTPFGGTTTSTTEIANTLNWKNYMQRHTSHWDALYASLHFKNTVRFKRATNTYQSHFSQRSVIHK